MATTVTGKIKIDLTSPETADIGGVGGSSTFIHKIAKSIQLANGVASGEVTFAYSVDSVSVTTSGVAYDLVGSALQSIVDQTTDVDLDEVLLVYVENTGSSGIDLLVGAGSNPIPGFVETEATHRTSIPDGGFHIYYFGPGGVAVTGGSADALNLDVASSSTTARVLILGK